MKIKFKPNSLLNELQMSYNSHSSSVNDSFDVARRPKLLIVQELVKQTLMETLQASFIVLTVQYGIEAIEIVK